MIHVHTAHVCPILDPAQWIYVQEVIAKAILISIALTFGVWLIGRGRK